MTITDNTTIPTATFELVVHDLYRDIHKGIRTELFALTTSAGNADFGDATACADVAAHTAGAVALLESHAEHEDGVIGPALEIHLPELAERIEADHVAFDARTRSLVELAEAVGSAGGDRRRVGHLLYLELASFTGDYLVHQDVEERVVMPALERAVGLDAVVAMHQAIVGSIPPPEMAKSLAIMLPAMNVEDRTELLRGMQAEAPAEVFEGVWSLAGSVLRPADLAALAKRLGL